MIAYAQIVNDESKQVFIGTGSDAAYYESIGMTQMEVEHCEWNDCWYVAGYVPPQPEPTHDEQIARLKKELKEIDEQSIRSLRAIQSGSGTEEDTAKLAELESQATSMRQKIKDLQGE